MKRLVMFLLAAVGTVAAASNASVEEVSGDLVDKGLNSSRRGMKSVDWNGDAMETPLVNVTARIKSLENLLEVFNPQRLARRWIYPYDNLTNDCGTHMDQYLSQLGEGVLWALKMADASGRYVPSFFWGNSYWTGSESLCYHLNSNASKLEAPPFKLGFYTVRLQIALPQYISPNDRRFLLGLCLPFSCNKQDVRQLLQLSARDEEPEPRSIQILKVRSPHNSYIMWHDRTFWILFAVSVLVLSLMALGTGYDIYLVHQSRHFFNENYTYEITRASPPHLGERPMKLDVGSFTQSATLSSSDGVINHGLEGSLGTLNESIHTTSNDSDTSENLGLVAEMVLAFSVRRNVLTICDQCVGSDTIPTIHGLRSISMGWVILGHTCLVAFKYSDNMEYRSVVEKEFLFQTINNGAYSVDTFFFISGLLVSFLYFRTVSKIDITQVTRSTGFQNSALQYVGLMAYRYGRLTVPYLFVLGVVEVTMKWFYYNSVFEPPTADHVSCPSYWWRNALYINTLFPVQDMCMLWSWYLADDTQFYVLGCALLILAVSYFRVAAVLTIIFLISSWFTTAFIAYNNRHNPSVDDPLALFDKIYDKPWTRLGPYLVGMIVGWILYKTDCKLKMSKVAVALGWMLCIGCLTALVYGLYDTHLDRIPAAAYSSLSHTAWAICLSWIVIACSTGYGGYVNKLLSASFLYPFSRVTYCAYLVHPIMIRIMAMRMDSPMHLSLEIMTIIFFGQVVASYILSFVVSLAFEAPVVSLLKIVAPERRKKSQ
ncbi:hypothetical protein B7P43_G14861 [Cryptotermes secundus]|uniref:Nose resistant-to-fluoxetine protein N-terminal domain-containing protein n=2 Tax=Cryptotermes secundus TaxID=105785 RepID=A0A2J7QRL5_9NEOP|nr:O-acyltransferase like protein isoform X1 [Cryptotermes secundus]PNF31216.1 hypothetical protein B7P43_G14861 [Cryptotermes secundus]